MIEEDFEDEEFLISKSQIKREMHALKDLGRELVKLSPDQLEKMPVSKELLFQVLEAKKFKQKALKRQLQRIGVLMREENSEAIQKALVRIHKPERQQVKEFHKIEKWRDDLLTGEGDVIEEITAAFSEIDHQYINQMIRNAKKEKQQNKTPKSSRALFKYLQSLHEKKCLKAHMKLTKKMIFLIFSLLLFVGPLYVLMSGSIKLDQDWRTVSRQSAGIAPKAAFHDEAIVQAYSARAFNWRGAFGVHTWIATKEKGAHEYKVHQVVGWNLFRDLSVVVSEKDLPDRLWYGQPPEIIADHRGEVAEMLISKIQMAVDNYPYPFKYRVWPGPNSNTFIAHIARQVPEMKLQLPSTAIGKDYLTNANPYDRTPSGTGYQFSLLGIFGIAIAKTEGLEFNFLGLNFGIDFDQKAIVLPGLDRINF